ncbi:unnamed protein product [Caenorhabditis brenneri]
MSLSRPVKFPLLKLPWLCIKEVVKSWDMFDIIFFALISQKTRRIVKLLNFSLKRIKIYLTGRKWIELGSVFRKWNFRKESEPKSFFEALKNLKKNPLVLQKNAIPLYTCRTDDSLESFCKDDETTALKMAMEFLTEVFKCSVETVHIDPDSFPESGDIGVKSAVNLSVNLPFKYAQGQKLSLLLENLGVTGTCTFGLYSIENGFYGEPKLFKCKELMFFPGSAAWVTREILLQFDVPQFTFLDCPFSVEDILSFVTNWFHSDNKKLERLYIAFQCEKFSSVTFRTAELNPVPFRERNRAPPSVHFRGIDFSKGLEIVRHDGLQATIHATGRAFLFYIWHDRSAIPQN